MKIKVCGLTQFNQLQQLDELGVSFGGMIFYPKSLRCVLKYMNPLDVKKYKGHASKIGVFVNSTYDEIMNYVEDWGLNMVQLHGEETPRFCERLSEQLKVIKAFRISPDDSIDNKIRHYKDVCDMFLFDTAGETYGGTGKKFDWNTLHQTNIDKPFFLSGGIGPTDTSVIKNFQKDPNNQWLFGVDINSKFETTPGIKDMELVRKFVSELSV